MKSPLIVCVILAATAVFHLSILYERSKIAKQAPPEAILNIPSEIGSFRQRGADIQASDSVRAVLQTSAILTRSYLSDQGVPVDLAIVYSTKSRSSIHFPEVCLVGEGWEIRQQTLEPVGVLFEGKHVILFKNNQEQAVLYWFKTGDHMTGNFFENSLQWVKGMLSFSNPTTALIRLSTRIGPQGSEAAFEVLNDFATQLTPVLLDKLK